MRAGALALLCAADLLVAVDGMVVTVALPAIQREFDTAPEDLQWVVTAYTLSLGAFLLVGGGAADLYGRRRVLGGDGDRRCSPDRVRARRRRGGRAAADLRGSRSRSCSRQDS